MNLRLSPNRALIRLWWRTVRAIDVFPIPPAPMSAIGSRFSASSMTFSIISSRPMQTLRGGGGDSPRGPLCRCGCESVDPLHSRLLTWVESGNDQCFAAKGWKRQHLRIEVGRRYLPALPVCCRGHPKARYESITPSGRHAISDRQLGLNRHTLKI